MPSPTQGPLRVLSANPMYFTADGSTPLCLAGAHTWSNLQNFGGNSPNFNFEDYLDQLEQAGHNCIRMWTWPGAITREQREQFPHPWPRVDATKFDVRRFDEQFFTRLRSRVQRAGQRGLYVIVMFFQQLSSTQGWDLLPSNRVNNINGVNDRLITEDGVVTGFQKTYAKEIVDLLNPFDNVLWEVGNEILSPYLKWETAMVGAIQRYQRNKPKQHVVGVNTGFGTGGASMQQLLATGADYIALLSADLAYRPLPWHWGVPVFADTDHLRQPLFTTSANVRVDWAWFSFVRGYHPIDMQAIQVRLPGARYANEIWNDLNNPSLPVARQALGAVLEVASYAPLERMKPVVEFGESVNEPLADQTLANPLQSTDLDGLKDPGAGLDDGAAEASTSIRYVLGDPSPDDPFYIGYSQGVDIVLDLSRVKGKLWWRTLDPRTAATTSGPTSIEGGDRREVFRGPGGRWVLVLSRDEDPTWRAR